MTALEKKGFNVKDLQCFITRYCEKVDIKQTWLEHQHCRYEYDPRALGSTFRLVGQSVDGRLIKAPLVFSLWSEVPYTLNATCWKKFNFTEDNAESQLEKSQNENSSDKLDPWLLY